MATVIGFWRFNETPTMSSAMQQDVNFTTANKYNFTGITEVLGHMEYVNRNAALKYHWAYSPYVWEDPWFRFINFGETEQTVSDTFYNWLTANAIPLSDEYITFVNNTSDTLYVVMYEYRELEEYNRVFADNLAPNVAITIHTNANFPVNVFRAHKGANGSDTILTPSINGVYVEGKEDFATAHAEPMSIPSGTTILFDDNSAEAELNRRWGVVILAEDDAEPEEPDHEDIPTGANYLEFSSPSLFSLMTYNSRKNWDGVLEYSTNGSVWEVWNGASLIVASSGKLYLRGTGNTRMASSGTPYTIHRWVLSGTDISCSGNIENLLDYATVAKGGHPPMAEGCFNYLFYGCKSLISAPTLPATVLSDRCYFNLFLGTGLTVAPELPATNLTFQCYFGMFESCANLIIPPTLPATNLAAECYKHMFQYDINLTKIPKLPATTLEQECYAYMFRGCTKILISATKTSEYQIPYRIPSSGIATTALNALTDMFDSTGGTFIGTPEINKTYYIGAGKSLKTLIAYNGATVEMAEGQTATLICAGKKMKTDVVIIPAFSVDFTYGDIKNTAEPGNTATLKCAGKKMATDVVIISTPISSNFVLADGSVLITSDGKIFEVK